MRYKTVFVHGLEGSSQGTKARFFRRRFPDMIIQDFAGSFAQRMDRLEDLLRKEPSLILVGSSFGGAMAAVFALNHPTRVKRLVLLAPALNFEAFSPHLTKRSEIPTRIIHGSKDDVVPVEPVRQIAQQVFKNLTFEIVEDDHVLTATFPLLDWESLLTANRVISSDLGQGL